jgi:hypothetical protein
VLLVGFVRTRVAFIHLTRESQELRALDAGRQARAAGPPVAAAEDGRVDGPTEQGTCTFTLVAGAEGPKIRRLAACPAAATRSAQR